MREVLKSVLKLSERQISDLEENDLIPEKKDFIFSYLKQINFDPKCKWSGGFCKCEDEFSDFEYNAIGSRNFNAVSRVALLKISPKCKELYNQSIKKHVYLACGVFVLIVVLFLIFMGISNKYQDKDECKRRQRVPDSLDLVANPSKIVDPVVSYDSQPTTGNSGFGFKDPFVATLVGSAFPTALVGAFGLRKRFSQDKVGKLKAQVYNESDSSYNFTYIGSINSKVLDAKIKDSGSNTKKVYQSE